jgi:hypothetical protein
MGRQFSYYACPEDLAEVESKVLRPLGGTMLMTGKRDGAQTIEAVDEFSLPLEEMGRETLFLFLSPPKDLQRMVFSGPWLDASKSHVIEIGRSYIKDGRIRLARYWYETKFLEDGAFVEKPLEFVDWAQAVFRLTKKMMTRRAVLIGEREYKEWFGQVAGTLVQEGRLQVE